MNKTFSLNTHIDLQSLRADGNVSDIVQLVRKMAEDEIQHRIGLLEKSRVERFITNEFQSVAEIIPLVNDSLEVGPPMDTLVYSRAELEKAGYVGLYRKEKVTQYVLVLCEI